MIVWDGPVDLERRSSSRGRRRTDGLGRVYWAVYGAGALAGLVAGFLLAVVLL